MSRKRYAFGDEEFFKTPQQRANEAANKTQAQNENYFLHYTWPGISKKMEAGLSLTKYELYDARMFGSPRHRKQIFAYVRGQQSNEKLHVAPANSAEEQQADAVAKKAVAGENTQTPPPPSTAQTTAPTPAITADFEEKLYQSKGHGEPLNESLRAEMQGLTGADLSDVMVHTDTNANQMADAINAQAFTHGKDVYLGSGQSAENKELMVHELWHVKQSNGDVNRTIWRKEENPLEFKALPEPKRMIVIQVCGLHDKADINSTYAAILDRLKIVLITYVSNDQSWGYGIFLERNKMGYVKMSNLAEGNSQMLKEVEISPDYYNGDLGLLADELYKLTHTKNFWGNTDAKAIEAAIPVNLSNEQRMQLVDIYWDKYNKSLFNDIYKETSNYLFKQDEKESGVIAFDRLSFPQSYRQHENVSITLSAENNKASAGSVITCTYHGPKFNAANSTGTNQQRINDKYRQEQKFRPKLTRWLVRKPDNDYEYEPVRKIDNTTFSFDADAVGSYSVMALVQWYNNEFIVIKDILTIVDPHQLANETLAKQKNLTDNTFAQQKIGLTAQLSAVKAARSFVPEADYNSTSAVKLINGSNPFMVYPSADHIVQRQNYKVSPAPDAVKFSWFVVPDDPFMLKGNSNLYFPDSERKNIHTHQLADSSSVYSPFTSLNPNSATSVNIPFPAIKGGVLDKNRFTIVCRQFDVNGNLILESNYVQYLNLFDTEENSALREKQNQITEQLERIDTFGKQINGTKHALPAVYVNEETGNALPIQLFHGVDAKNKNKTRLLDLTIGSSKTDYEGDNLQDALESMDYRESYPDGWIFVQLPNNTQKKMRTRGGSLVEQFTTWNGWVSTLLMVGGAALTLIPGLQGVGGIMIQSGMVMAGIGGIASIYNQLDQDKFDPLSIGLDILDLAATTASLGATGISFVAKLRSSEKLFFRGNQLMKLEQVLDASSTIYMTQSTAAEIDQISKDSRLSKEEKIQRIALVMARVLGTGAMMLLSSEDEVTLKHNNEIIAKQNTPAGNKLQATAASGDIKTNVPATKLKPETPQTAVKKIAESTVELFPVTNLSWQDEAKLRLLVKIDDKRTVTLVRNSIDEPWRVIRSSGLNPPVIEDVVAKLPEEYKSRVKAEADVKVITPKKESIDISQLEKSILDAAGNIDPVKLRSLLSSLEAKGVKIMTGEAAEQLLLKRNANAMYIPGDVAGQPGMLVLRENADRKLLIEEIFHLKQHELEGFRTLEPSEIIDMEIDAHNRMIEYAENRWSKEEVEQLKQNKEAWEGDQKKYMEDEEFRKKFNEEYGGFKNRKDQKEINAQNDKLPDFCDIKGNGLFFEFYDNDLGKSIGLCDIDKDGFITFAIYRKGLQTRATGKDVFYSLMKNYQLHGIEYKGINGVWGKSDNTDEINKLLNDNQNSLSIEEAARLTWTGKRASEYGFNNVEVLFTNPKNPPFDSLKVRFY
jgi:hypothetical protein